MYELTTCFAHITLQIYIKFLNYKPDREKNAGFSEKRHIDPLLPSGAVRKVTCSRDSGQQVVYLYLSFSLG